MSQETRTIKKKITKKNINMKEKEIVPIPKEVNEILKDVKRTFEALSGQKEDKQKN